MGNLRDEHGGKDGKEFSILNLETIKNAQKLLSKNGLLVINVDKPINVLTKEKSIIFH